jgi:hypothetical protein
MIMKKFKVSVVMSYCDVITVEADTQDEAEIKAFESFDLKRAWQSFGEVVRSEEMTDEKI